MTKPEVIDLDRTQYSFSPPREIVIEEDDESYRLRVAQMADLLNYFKPGRLAEFIVIAYIGHVKHYFTPEQMASLGTQLVIDVKEVEKIITESEPGQLYTQLLALLQNYLYENALQPTALVSKSTLNKYREHVKLILEKVICAAQDIHTSEDFFEKLSKSHPEQRVIPSREKILMYIAIGALSGTISWGIITAIHNVNELNAPREAAEEYIKNNVEARLVQYGKESVDPNIYIQH